MGFWWKKLIYWEAVILAFYFHLVIKNGDYVKLKFLEDHILLDSRLWFVDLLQEKWKIFGLIRLSRNQKIVKNKMRNPYSLESKMGCSKCAILILVHFYWFISENLWISFRVHVWGFLSSGVSTLMWMRQWPSPPEASANRIT